ncbi:MAG: MAPEG family protein [Terricaulis sp.]
MKREQLLILAWGAPALALILGAFWAVDASLYVLPKDWQDDRLRLGATCAAALGFWLIVAVLRVSLHRFFSDVDRPGAGLTEAPSPALRIKRANLQNTLEQVVLAALAHIAYAATAPQPALAILPLFVALFSLGRIAFMAGYRFGAAGRAFGFGLSFGPTLALYFLLAAQLFSDG